MNNYLIKTPYLSYIFNYYSNNFGFRESKIITINKEASKKLSNYLISGKETSFIKSLKEKSNLDNLKQIGSYENLLPIHFQIELTNSCNLSCDYCYMNAIKANNIRFNNIDTKLLISKLKKLKKNGVLEIGLTGGEPTLHPDFVKIALFAINNFELVEIITNGTNPSKLVKLINKLSSKNKCKLNLSISFNEWYRNHLNLFNNNFYLVNTINKIKNLHPIRVICSDYKFSKSKQLKNNLQLLKLGVKIIDYSYVAPIGRGKDKLSEKEYINKYTVNKHNAFTSNFKNCGLLFRHNCIDFNGNIRPCALFSNKIKLGNIFKDKYINKFILNNIELYDLFAPNPIICKNCNYYLYCRGCIYKGLFNSNKKCKYKKYVENDFPNIYKLIKYDI